MTLIVSVNGRETIWLLADRRLTISGRVPKEDARKIMLLETTDGVAILGYAGLGATSRGTEPAEWMSGVLRGRNLPLEQSLGVLTEAMKKELPRHMRSIPGADGPVHNVMVTAILSGEVRLYSIDLALSADRRQFAFRYTRHVVDKPPGTRRRTPPIVVAGSGGLSLQRNNGWGRDLARLVKASDRLKITPRAVADYLATINNQVQLADRFVGPNCIVAWRNRKEGVHNGGGGHQFYDGIARASSSPALPHIANGNDMVAILDVITPHMMKMFDGIKLGQPPGELD